MTDTLKDAYQFFGKHRYSDVIKILEPQVFRFRDNFNFYYILGMSCLYQGDYGGAFSYLKRAFDLKEDDVNTLLGIAAIYLKRGDTGNALRIWLDIIDLEPNNIYASRGLNYLRKNNNSDDLTGISSQDKINKFLPQHKKSRNFKPFIVIVSIIAAVSTLVLLPVTRGFFSEHINFSSIFSKSDENRPEIPEVSLDSRKDFINLNGNYSYILTEKEIEKKLKTIQDYLYEFRDNLAQREINMILMSNASEYVKNRVRLLDEYTTAPSLSDFKDNFNYSEVVSEPQLYKDCYILWKGKSTNLSETPDSITFDFLVGYHEEKILEGIVPVIFDFAIKITPDQPIELLGKIIIDEDGEIMLHGIAVHRL